MEGIVAGAAVGATIKVVLENLNSFPMEDIKLIRNFKKDVSKLQQSVNTIRDFLEDAETKQVTDKSVQRWLTKLESVAFDADYVFDEINYHNLRRRVKRDNRIKKKVSSFFSTSNSIVFRRRMAKKIMNINKKLKSINQEASELGLRRIDGGGQKGSAYFESDSLSADPIFVGRENDVKKIVEIVTSSPTEQEISVHAIVGMGGLGKTTLTRKVFNDANIVSHFGERIWVHMSETFDPVIVLKNILEKLTQENVHGSRQVVLGKLKEKIGDKRYLIVLDNVWNEDRQKWDNFMSSMKGISLRTGNVIMVTTRSRNVASIVKAVGVHELGLLSEDDCYFIIKTNAFGKEIPSEFKKIGEDIARRCGGLPLAAQVVGSFLCGKSRDEWKSMERNWISNFKDDHNTILRILKLSFDNLPSPSMKKCFAFCSIIPKGWRMEKDEIIDLWMAEGFLQTDQEKDMEMVGNEVFNLLLQSSLLQVLDRDEDRHVKEFNMHDFVHDLAFSILNSKFLDDPYQVRYIHRSGIDDSTPIPKENAKCLRTLLFQGKASHMRFADFKYLHVLILMDEDAKEFPIEIVMLICLRYLDITHTRIECLPDSISNLYHLQTLRASTINKAGCLRKLPDTFEYLINLRHLYIPNMKLPPNIGKLICLQTLTYFEVGDEDGCGIMELESLSNLKGELEIHNLEKVSDKEEAKSADLFHKPNILKLKLVWKESEQGESNYESVSERLLNNLELMREGNESEQGESNYESVLEGLQPHPNLKSLEINGFKGRSFPLWTMRMEVREKVKFPWERLVNLIEIKLSNCNECQEIPMLGHLPHLKSLYLHHLHNVICMGSSFYGIVENGDYKETVIVFPELEKLELIDMPQLTAWTNIESSSSSHESQPRRASAFPRLQYLKITNCGQLESAPSDFPCLKELEIDDMRSGLPLAKICGSKLTSLTKLKIKEVDGLVCLPEWLFSNNRDLLKVKIEDCVNLTHLVPCLGGGGASLKKLVIDTCVNLKELPEDLHKLNALEELRINYCLNLKSITYNLSGGGGHLSSQGGFTSLRKLQISFCRSVANLPIQMMESCMSSLESLILGATESITNFPQVMSILTKMPRLVALVIEKVPKFNEVAGEIVSLGSLQSLGIGGSSDCRDYVSFKASLDLIFPTMKTIRELSLCGMEDWDALPDHLRHLTTLRALSLGEFGIEALPDWFGNFSSLNILILISCKRLRHLPSKNVMQNLTKLTQLHIIDCPVLKQNLEEEEASDDNSEWSKISHIPKILVDKRPFSAHSP